MQVTIASRHMDLTDAIRQYVMDALGRIEHHFEKVIDVDVILDVDRRHQIAELNLHANGLRINAKEASEDLYGSIDAAVLKLDRQLLKHKDRIMRHQPRTTRESRSVSRTVLERVAEAGESSGERPGVNPARVNGHRVVLRETIEAKPMSVDEAALQLELIDDVFLAFSNAETNDVNVLYKRNDGTFGLLEP